MDRSSFAASDTTYHSFHDIELQEPPSPPRNRDAINSQPHTKQVGQSPTSVKMQRQDSGYESHISGSARNSMSQTRPGHSPRRMSNGSSTNDALATSRARARPSTRRSAKSYPLTTVQAVHPRGTNKHAQPAVYFQFPTPDLVELTETPSRTQPSAHLPPPTTHYWTSDSTRRLEYAAIDAASRGVKGWIRRHLVPDCFTPRHVAFDDDSGSVRRYRIELEDEDHEKHGSRSDERRKGWSLFSLRKSSTL
ncbi:hypothetical protein QQS21_008012 [Conoideocrella luteorostrata]|uniref:Uncharacterized protein n=1 Tax=Conoideocrella luteorostrata TaxID=1105319 RepID=A0AAJ0CP39_9HYPO|nr:hypothetical protein QQS21_008012 [Conoideocrella luteorostrata]